MFLPHILAFIIQYDYLGIDTIHFFFFFSEVACRPFGLRLRRVVSECGLTDCACVCEWADCDFSRMGSDWGPWAAIGDWATIGDPFSDWLPWAAIGERGNPRASEKVC